MELLLIVVVLLAIMLIISDSRVSILKEDKHFLREENIFLRNDLRRMISVIENLAENRKNNNSSLLICEKRQRRKKSKKIFIFNGGELEEESKRLRDLLKKNSITGVILVDFKVLSLKLSGTDNIMIEESSLIIKNLYNLPIIFYGGNREDFEAFISYSGGKGRKDIVWVKNPFEEEEFKQALKKIRNKNVG